VNSPPPTNDSSLASFPQQKFEFSLSFRFGFSKHLPFLQYLIIARPDAATSSCLRTGRRRQRRSGSDRSPYSCAREVRRLPGHLPPRAILAFWEDGLDFLSCRWDQTNPPRAEKMQSYPGALPRLQCWRVIVCETGPFTPLKTNHLFILNSFNPPLLLRSICSSRHDCLVLYPISGQSSPMQYEHIV
jgi:hypothetical protein